MKVNLPEVRVQVSGSHNLRKSKADSDFFVSQKLTFRIIRVGGASESEEEILPVTKRSNWSLRRRMTLRHNQTIYFDISYTGLRVVSALS